MPHGFDIGCSHNAPLVRSRKNLDVSERGERLRVYFFAASSLTNDMRSSLIQKKQHVDWYISGFNEVGKQATNFCRGFAVLRCLLYFQF